MLVNRRAVLVGIVACCALVSAPSAAQAYSELNPGGVPKFDERVPVNVVFVGFDEDDARVVRRALAARRQRVADHTLARVLRDRRAARARLPLRLPPHLHDPAWEDGFFAYLRSIAVTHPLTEPQVAYNDQAGNALDVTSNAWIDAPKVEKRLIDAAPAGVDTGAPRSSSSTGTAAATSASTSTSKTGEPDPDTGFDFGAERDNRKIVAWGGTTPDDEETGLGSRGVRRVWFYDLSAGPEEWGGNCERRRRRSRRR